MKLFLSYSSDNRRLVEKLVNDLEQAGYTVWFDRELAGGQEWWTTILENIRNCDIFLFAATTRSLKSDPCRYEYEYALSLKRPVLPVALADVNPKQLPSSLQKLQLINYQHQNKEQVLDLVKALNSFCVPKSLLLPESLPPEPEIPLSPLAQMRHQITSHLLNEDDQRLLVSKIKDFLYDDESATEAWELLEALHSHDSLLAKVEKEIKSLLDNKPKQKFPKRRNIKLEPRQFVGHTGEVTSVAFSPDGQYVLTGSKDFTARLWDVVTGETVQRFVGHEGCIKSIAFSPDGQQVLTGSEDKTARFWETINGQEISRFVGHNSLVNSVAIAPSGDYILTGSNDATAYLWDIGGNKFQEFNGHRYTVTCVVFSPDGHTVLTGGSDYTLRKWEVATGREVLKLDRHTETITSLAFLPDGSSFISASRDHTARLWDAENGQFIRPFVGHQKDVLAVSISSDGKYLLSSSSDCTARIWDIFTGDLLNNINTSYIMPRAIAWSHDCRYIVISLGDSVRILESGLDEC